MFRIQLSRHVRPTLLGAIFVVAMVLANAWLGPNTAHATTVGPPGCDKTHPYNCAMSRGNFSNLINGWCSLANSDKQNECKLTFYTFVYTSPGDVKSHANFTIPKYCALNFPADDTQKSNIPDFCYVVTKQSSKFYDATKQIIDDCGLPDNQDQSCASDVKQQFLHDYNSSWASKPNSPTTISTGLDKKTKASETPIIQRVNIYLKWITAGIGVLAVFGLVISGIQYTAAGDNAQQVSDAKKRISNIVIGLLLYMFMFAALQWLVPGGIF